MAQAGFFVAASELEYKPYDYLFTRIQSNDNIYAGMSSFAVEMSEFKIIMKYANANSIILGDELCSGTETLDATALVAAGINKLASRRASFIFATHLHYLSTSKYITSLPMIKMVHLSVVYDQKTRALVYERKLRHGSGPSSYGIEVCKAMNMDDDYMDMAQKIREELSDAASSATVKILGKQSVYNQDKILTMCEVCKSAEATDTHHIKFQCSADENAMIDHWHKDSKFNLVGLCKPCHQRVHAASPTLSIIGYRMTSSGVELEFKENSTSPVSMMMEPPEYKEYDEEIVKKVREFAMLKITPKAIQVRLKTLYGKTVKITEIKDIVIKG
jgi:DNA mismatch repair protein MutS